MTNKEYANIIVNNILNDKGNGGFLDITKFVDIPSLKSAKIYLIEYNYKNNRYERVGMNSWCQEDELQNFVEEICERLNLEKRLSESSLCLDCETILLEFENGKTISFSSSEWSYFDF